jgi:3-hydroxybutyryl-CoA dehydrogenase
MGHGIAQVAAQAGMSVRIQDTLQGGAKGAIDRIAKNLAKGVELGKLATADRDAALGRLSAFDEIVAAVGEADIIIEAVPEKIELKREIFAAVEKVASPNALFATNTSSLPIGELANELKDPSRMVGMHFFNPVHLMKLVEVVRHKKAAEGAVTLAVALVEKLGKTAITVNDSPGFASSRLGIAIGLEAMRMVEEGVASAADIDTAMKLGYGHPMGPLELTDLVGLDVRLGIAEYLERALGPSFEPPQILIDKVANGLLGKKTGAGFYKWGADGKKS